MAITAEVAQRQAALPSTASRPTEDILKERGSKYGTFMGNATVTQAIMTNLTNGENYSKINYIHKEALHMIAHKMSRIVNGDPNYIDSWADIAGYAKLMADHIAGENK